MIKALSAAVPFKSRFGLASSSALVGAATAPGCGFIYAGAVPFLNEIGAPGSLLAMGLTTGLSIATWPFLLAKGFELFSPSHKGDNKEKVVRLGQMVFTERALFTNLLITGTIGSGKTSSVIYPVLRQICNNYNKETEDPEDPAQKWGGLVLDVKGEFYETLIYFMHISGRNVLYDVILVRPDADYPIVKFIDPDTNLIWYVTAAGSAEGREIDMVTKGYKVNGEGIPSTLFTNDAEFREEKEPALRQITFDITKDLCYIGWRLERGRLHRVDYTDKNGVIHYKKDANGKDIYADPPKRLQYLKVEQVNNGLRYNICSPHLPAAEVANRLISIAETLGGGGGGDNQYWTDAAKKLIGFIIFLWRALHKEQCSALEIVRLTMQKSALEEQLALLTGKIEELGEAILTTNDAHAKKEKEGKKRFLLDVERYFTEEWIKLDQKTKGIIISVISNLFGPFITDYKLQEVFCKPATFSFESTIQEGKVFTLLTGGAYETLAKQLGTSLKMDFQSIAKARTSQAHLNKKRIIMFLADEAQMFVTAGGGNNTGDENFMALSRQSRVINIIATQSDSSIISVIGEKKAPVYFQSFGGRVWLQNTDYTTNQNATRVLGKTKKEKITSNGKEVSLDTFFSKEGGPTVNSTYEDDERFKLETFSQLDVFDAIVYNKDKKGVRDKACKYKGKPDPVGQSGSVDAVGRLSTLRWYYQAYIENRLRITGELDRVNHDQGLSDDEKDSYSDAARVAEEAAAEAKKAQEAELDLKKGIPVKTEEKMPLVSSAETANPETLSRSNIKAKVNLPTISVSKGAPPIVAAPTATVSETKVKGKMARALVKTETVAITGAQPAFADEDEEVTSPFDDKIKDAIPGFNDMDTDMEDEEAEELLHSEATGISPARIEEMSRKYGSPATIGKQLIEFASLIDESELPMSADYDPSSFLLKASSSGGDEAGIVGPEGIFSKGKFNEPSFPPTPLAEKKNEEQQPRKPLIEKPVNTSAESIPPPPSLDGLEVLDPAQPQGEKWL